MVPKPTLRGTYSVSATLASFVMSCLVVQTYSNPNKGEQWRARDFKGKPRRSRESHEKQGKTRGVTEGKRVLESKGEKI